MYKLRGVAVAATVLMTAGGIAACGSSSDGDESSSASGASSQVDVPQSVKDAGTLNLAAFLNSPPYRYLDANNKPVGAEVEMAQAVADVMGVDVEFHDVAFDATIPSVAAGRYDWALGYLQDNEERRQVVDFLDWVNVTDYVAVHPGNPKNASPDNLCGLTIANTAASAEVTVTEQIIEDCKADGQPPAVNLELQDFAQAQQAVLSGRADAIMTSPATLQYLSEQTDGQFEVLDGPVPQSGQHPAGWQFNKDNPDMEKAAYQAIQVLIEDGTWQKILEKYGLADIAIVPPTINLEPAGF